jgi:hypothetical protein
MLADQLAPDAGFLNQNMVSIGSLNELAINPR